MVRRILRVLKWSLAVWCLILVIAWPLSVTRAFGGLGLCCEVYIEGGAIFSFVAWMFVPPGFIWRSGNAPEWSGSFHFAAGGSSIGIIVPIWLALLISIPLTALLFRLDRKRIPPGHCQSCGYDLTGNVSGKCPECSEPVPPQPTSLIRR